ncbi:hypothetical protein BJY16_006939 [Actinoplanes octamycinicus]|uniref:Uncharacterized protein n=1 Tax=Actinoplanes octamycinicus TaxID=135948 RepID=A0A7W7H3T0_9ACTN|nr:hypothetical protein [Actinoplanes octamycinicus]MBB4743480.1 hypothetical protein [Actinoplanes octamycinicus]GIE62534.1 hypothetical protein Aoc01nite_79360 [Actinoplanes octamycinicus]
MLTDEQAADYVRRYDGVSATILTDGSGLVARRVFWLTMFDGCAESELIGELFGGEDEDIAGFSDELRAAERWPVIPIGERFAQVIWHGHDFEGGDDYVVLTPGRAISVAAREGHGYGPGLSWAEFDRLATTPERLLLALPAFGDADAPPEAADRIAAAFTAVGKDAPAAATEAARQILDNPARWTTDEDVLVCDGDYAVRKRGGLPDADLRLVTATLATA